MSRTKPVSILAGFVLVVLGVATSGRAGVSESARGIPVAYRTDVVVVGGGTDAVAAAVAAATRRRRNCIDPYPFWCQFDSQVAGKSFQGGFGDAYGSINRHNHSGTQAGNINDNASVFHQSGRLLSAEQAGPGR